MTVTPIRSTFTPDDPAQVRAAGLAAGASLVATTVTGAVVTIHDLAPTVDLGQLPFGGYAIELPGLEAWAVVHVPTTGATA